MRKVSFLAALLLVFSCGDDSDTPNGTNDGTNNGTNNGSNNETNGSNNGSTGPSELANGSSCMANSECASGVCEAFVCVEFSNGPKCGDIYCVEAFQCLEMDVCGTDG